MGNPKSKPEQVPIIWKLNAPGLLEEIAQNCRDAAYMSFPLNVFRKFLRSIAEYAVKKDDPELNILMLRMGLYDVPKQETDEAILGELEKLNLTEEEKKQWVTKLKNAD